MKHFFYSLLLAIPLTFISLVHAGKSGGGLAPNTVAKANSVTCVDGLKENPIILKQNDNEWVCKPLEK